MRKPGGRSRGRSRAIKLGFKDNPTISNAFEFIRRYIGEISSIKQRDLFISAIDMIEIQFETNEKMIDNARIALDCPDCDVCQDDG